MKRRVFQLSYASLISSLMFFLPLFIVSCTDESDEPDRQYTASAPFEYYVGVTTQTGFELSGVNGEIDITGVTNEDSVRIRGERIVHSNISQADADAKLELLQVEIESSADLISVATEQPQESDGRTYIVNYDDVMLPRELVLTVSDVNGEVTVDHMAAPVSASIVNGELLLSGNQHNVAGSMVNGRIYCDTDLPENGICSLSGVNGEIELYIPQNTSATLAAQTVNGQVSVRDLTLHDATITRTSVAGTLGSGDGAISVSTVNGDVLVRARTD